ncbi:MAG: zinc-ribbon domain-containing protein [Clostridia bacterium]|nr:zinc-ribbon domain-containing protein [Clostridia bacterium]
MYCSHCGKKVTDTMLFCPFCGDPIVIPDQDDDVPSQPEPAEREPRYARRDEENAPETFDPTPDAGKSAPSSGPAGTVRAQGPAPEGASMAQEDADGVSDGGEAPPISAETPVEEKDPWAASPLEETASEPLWPSDAEWEAMRSEFERADKGEPLETDAKAELEQWSRDRSRVSDELSGRAPFSPLALEQDEADGDWRGEIERKKQAVVQEKKPPEVRQSDAPKARLEGRAPKLKAGAEDGADPGKKWKAASTLVPAKAQDLDDLFMDDEDELDDFGGDFSDEEYAYEEEGENSFFMRHIRGFVGLALLMILALMFVIYAFSKAGQLSLARVNLAWSVNAYRQLGDASSEDEQYESAGQYYERALSRDEDNYDLASAAAMAYIRAENLEKATQMLKRCAALKPEALEAYYYLLQLYPDAANRPWEITQLIQQGYQLTGDSRLNVTG